MHHTLAICLILLTVLYIIVMIILFIRFRAAMEQLRRKMQACQKAEQQKKAAANTAFSEDAPAS